MNLSEYTHKNQIIEELSARTKNEVLAELIKPLTEKYSFLNQKEVYDVLLTRENLGTTGIGDGVAIPHGKLEHLDQVLLVTARSSSGVDFAALDHKLVHIFFLVLAPEKSAGKHLKILAFISRMLQNQAFRDAYMRARDRDELWNLINKT
ncbi:MAG: PTS sugar transporter subunit IIA [Desulfonatronovibrio sp. MSAO_Bac4]|nr:MAG: PTS sugar transporter subunit IIA [Desulfonatronovibrio sp. MSAO_Bac4]